MIPEIGHFALILALGVALIQAVVPLIGVWQQNTVMISLARRCAFLMALMLFVSFACLATSFLTNDFSVLYVAQNSNSHLPKIYQFCAIWGAHEGSLLLWVTLLGGWMCAVAWRSRNLPDEVVAQILSVLAMIAIGFLLLIVVTSNPFVRILPISPTDGRDLNALLQDPGLVSHPPMLYMGYVGFSVAFAFAITALLNKKFDAQWAAWTRPWTLTAWAFLTLGVVLGSAWAYRVLGWGGWWFWDPVENASFMPWLVGTALVHSLIVANKRNTFKAWTVLLAISAFSLSLVGTFLVRSGVLVSVHSFAVDAKRGTFILIFLSCVIISSLLLYAFRAPQVRDQRSFSWFSRESLMQGANLLLTACMLTVLLGTIYPLIIDALHIGKLSVGAPYFNAVFVPLITPLLLLLGLAPLIKWDEGDWMPVWQRYRWYLLVLICVAIAVPWWYAGTPKFGVTIGLLLSGWIILTTILRLRVADGKGGRVWRSISLNCLGMTLAHIGVAVCVLGVVLSQAFSLQREVAMSVGDSVSLGNYQFELMGFEQRDGPNYQAQEAHLRVYHHGKVLTTLLPEARTYSVQQMSLPKSAIDAGVFSDLYVVLGQPLNDTRWTMRIYFKPFVRWIWAGGFLMMLGGLIAAIGVSRKAKLLRQVAYAK